jgi:1,2-diacylglycerol 3-alpha-glucosyltransferase
MRIGIFTDSYPPFINGVSTSITMLENALRKMGHEVFIVTVNPDTMNYEVEDDRIIRLPGVPIPMYDYRLAGTYSVRAEKKIKEWNLDVIHTQTEFSVGTFARVIAKRYDIPLVHTYHTMYEDYVHYITKGYFNKSSKKIVEYLTKFYCDTTATELIVPTAKAYDLFKTKYHYQRNIHIIPTGIEVEKFYIENIDKKKLEQIKKKLGIKKDDFIVLTVGRMAEEKSVDFLIKNQVELVKKNKNCKLILVGDGPDLESYKELASSLKLGNNAVFTGKVPWEEVCYYYNLANVFTSASHTETQGLTVIEAMAASTPVVALNDESFKNVVIPDLNGYLFNNDEEYQKYILNIMNDKNKQQHLSRQARINAETYSAKYFGERVLNVYEEAIKNNYDGEKKTFFHTLKKVIKKGLHGE